MNDLRSPPLDVVLLATEWQPRALLRAQLIEEGFEVLATDNWSTMRRFLRPGSKPALAIVDLQGLGEPDRVLKDLKILMKPSRVLVLTSIGTVAPDEIEALGFQVVRRPIRVGSLIATAARTLHNDKSSALDAGGFSQTETKRDEHDSAGQRVRRESPGNPKQPKRRERKKQ